MNAFQESFGLDKNSKDFSNLQGNIVSVLQAGCFFGALSSFYISDTFGRRMALIIADAIFIIGSLVQTLIWGGNLSQLYVGRVIGGFGVGLISAVVPTYIGECAPKQIRGRCIGCMQLFNVTGICLAFFVNYVSISARSPWCDSNSSSRVSISTSQTSSMSQSGESHLLCRSFQARSFLRVLYSNLRALDGWLKRTVSKMQRRLWRECAASLQMSLQSFKSWTTSSRTSMATRR
jgi:fucose permease